MLASAVGLASLSVGQFVWRKRGTWTTAGGGATPEACCKPKRVGCREPPIVPGLSQIRRCRGANRLTGGCDVAIGGRIHVVSGCSRARPLGISRGVNIPTPIPHAPLTTMGIIIDPPSGGAPFSGATTNHPTKHATIPNPKPQRTAAPGKRGSASPNGMPYRAPQKVRLAISGTPNGAVGRSGNGAGIKPYWCSTHHAGRVKGQYR